MDFLNTLDKTLCYISTALYKPTSVDPSVYNRCHILNVRTYEIVLFDNIFHRLVTERQTISMED